MNSRPLYAKRDLAKPSALLGGLSPADFMRDYWQKRPLFVKNAFDPARLAIDADDMLTLAGLDEVESRLVVRAAARRKQIPWRLASGPFDADALPPRTQPGWTLLVQGVNLHDVKADALLREFSFIPDARLDDLMISFATDGGGVGPHFDSYDVFLLQVEGQRHWQISAQRDLRLVDGYPLKILSDFRPTQGWLVEPGDLLYLPPRYAHDGVAVGECMTASVGFRAATEGELVGAFLGDLGEDLADDPRFARRYRDPGQGAVDAPARLPDAMIDGLEDALARVRWRRDDVAAFLGRHLSEPKPHVFFEPPRRPGSPARFAARAARHGLALDLRSIALYDKRHLFLNGETLDLPAAGALRRALVALADRRELDPNEAKPLLEDPDLLTRAHGWYTSGWLLVN